MKKVIISILIIFAVLFSSLTVYGLMSREEIDEKISEYSEEIPKLQEEIETKQAELDAIKDSYDSLKNTLGGVVTEEDMTAWFNKCSEEGVRATVAIETALETGILFSKKELTVYGTGVIIEKNDNGIYILTAYSNIDQKQAGQLYTSRKITIYDCYKKEYNNVSIYSYNNDLNLAVLYILNSEVISNDSKLNALELGDIEISKSTVTCSIYSNRMKVMNHMHFSKVLSSDGEYFTIDKNNSENGFGEPVIGANGKLVGLVLGISADGYKAINAKTIERFIKDLKF